MQLDGALRRRCARWPGAAAAARGVRDAARADAEAVVRLVDDRHLARVREARAPRSSDRWRPAEREAVRRAPGRGGGVLAGARRRWPSRAGTWGCCCHVLRLFAVAAPPDRRRLVRRGDGADRPRAALPRPAPPNGPVARGVPRRGAGLAARRVLLPHARRRLRSDDPARMAELAVRAAPAALRGPRRRRAARPRARTARCPPDARGRAARRAGIGRGRHDALAINRLQERRSRTPPPSTGSWPATRCRSSRATGARSCGAARPTPCTSCSASSGCPTGCRCGGCGAPTCGTSSWSCPRARGSNYQLEVRRGDHVECINDPLNPKLSYSPVGTLVGVLRARLPHARLDRARPGRPARRAHRASWCRSRALRRDCPVTLYLPARFRRTVDLPAAGRARRRRLPAVRRGQDRARQPDPPPRRRRARRRVRAARATGSSSTPNSPAHARFLTRELRAAPGGRAAAGRPAAPAAACSAPASARSPPSRAAYRAPDVYGALVLMSGSFVFTDIAGADHGGGPVFDPVVEVRQPLPGAAAPGRRPALRQLRGVRAADHAQPLDGAHVRVGGHDGAVPASPATATAGRTGATASATRCRGCIPGRRSWSTSSRR